MRKIFLINVLFFLCVELSSQTLKKIITYYDKDKTQIKEEYFYNEKLKKLDSTFISYYQNGNKKSEGNYKNDQIVGNWTYYYESGSVKALGEYKRNAQNGFWSYYYENGQTSMEGKMLDGKKTDYWKTYFENNIVKSEGNYVKGKQDGNWNFYNELGERKGTANLNNGYGEYSEYFPSGALKANGFIKNGVSDSVWTYYHENGQKKAEGREKNGVKVGEWKSYHNNGVLAEEGSYKQGKPTGNWKFYHKNGKLSAEGNQDDGQKSGKWSYYYDTGDLKGESEFSLLGEGEYKEYYTSGKLKAKGRLKNGKNSGSWEYFYETGEKEGEANYENGSGKYTGYYNDGTKKMEGNVVDGVKVGTWSLFDEQGVLKGIYRHISESESDIETETVETKKSTQKDTTSTKEKLIDHKKNEVAKKTSKRFTPNVYKSFIVGINPTGILINQLPIYVEYYFEKTKGFEIQYTSIRNPFFSNFSKQAINKEYFQGYSVTFKNKYYKNPKINKGMWYLAYDLRYTNVNNFVSIIDSINSNTNLMTKDLVRNAQSFEITGQFGDRFIKQFDKPNLTFDLYLGIGLGYKLVQKRYTDSFYYDSFFETKNIGGFYLPLRLGFNIGYLF